MSKMKRMAQAVRTRALAAIEKKSSAARDGENPLNDKQEVSVAGSGLSGSGSILSEKAISAAPSESSGVSDLSNIAIAEVKDASAAPSGSPGVSEGKSCAQRAEPGFASSNSCLIRKKAGPPIRFSRGGSVPDIFPDGEVCRLLGKNRAYLIRARKSKSRGEDWDTIGHHAGMTASWILKENPKADFERITPWSIKPDDGVVSVEVLQHTMDCRKLACKRLSDGATVVVMVDDASRFRDGDQFDAQEFGGAYRWNPALNRI